MYTVRDALFNMNAGKIQIDGNMAVIPLIQDDASDANILIDGFSVSVKTYGTVKITNENDMPTIVPPGTIYKGTGQDHTIINPHVLGPKKSIVDTTAGCVQSTVGGYIKNIREYTFLPVSLRRAMHSKRQEHKYSKMWSDLLRFNQRLGLRNREAWDEYYTSMSAQMDQFAAAFEPVQNQRGAIIFIDGSFAGIEIYPSHEAWMKVWRKLLRDSYAIEALASEKPKRFEVELETSLTGDIELRDLANAVLTTEDNTQRRAKKAFNGIAEERLINAMPDTITPQSSHVHTTTLLGDIITHQGETVFLSVIKLTDTTFTFTDLNL